ncbi:MAG: hypothetical protein L0229_08960 [Blastocatellia bacterium]|nr:hypothetical protein [Blastocatellia bacterium]
MKLENDKFIRNLIGATALGAGALAAYAFLLRPWHLRWGATDDETDETLPGDEFVPHPESEATHAITIDAPVSEVWPWLVQVGQTRGGFYSYAWLENLVGCDMYNADRVIPEWQTLRVGDVVWLHPKAPPLPVILVEPYRAIVLGNTSDEEEEKGINAGTWGFYLKEVDENTTRLLMRGRWNREPGLVSWLANYALLEPAHFVMERKMMLGIKQRAEAPSHQPADETETGAAASAASGSG